MASTVLSDFQGTEGRWLEIAEPSIYGDDVELRITGPNRGIKGRITLERAIAINLAREILAHYEAPDDPQEGPRD